MKSITFLCPTGGVPPIANPVISLTKSASGLLMPSPIYVSIILRST
jgi:hypothetical protein